MLGSGETGWMANPVLEVAAALRTLADPPEPWPAGARPALDTSNDLINALNLNWCGSHAPSDICG
jgi:hypothetical protein